jgi:hypothetical protein
MLRNEKEISHGGLMANTLKFLRDGASLLANAFGVALPIGQVRVTMADNFGL